MRVSFTSTIQGGSKCIRNRLYLELQTIAKAVIAKPSQKNNVESEVSGRGTIAVLFDSLESSRVASIARDGVVAPGGTRLHARNRSRTVARNTVILVPTLSALQTAGRALANVRTDW